MDSYEITANAKINLFLRVCGILPNGYHSLYSVMQEIDLSDSLTVNIYPEREEGFEIKCIGRDDIDPEKNLCRKARDRFFSSLRKKASADPSVSNASVLKNGTFPYIEMVLTKRIPSESGIGGGSSDAAAVLMVLQECVLIQVHRLSVFQAEPYRHAPLTQSWLQNSTHLPPLR